MKDSTTTTAPATTSEERGSSRGTPGKSPRTGRLQMKESAAGASRGGSRQDIAAGGFTGSSSSVPYRSQMESGFGVSFSGVEVHTGGAAAAANAQLGSEAYAVGQQVAFKSSAPSPAIVAHELAHTIQQGAGGSVQSWSEGSPGDSFEHEADQAAATVLSGGVANVASRTGPSIQKWSGADHYTLGNTAGQKALAAFDSAFPGANPHAPRMTLPDAVDGTRANGTHGGTLGGGVRSGERGSPEIGTAADQTTMGIRTTGDHTISMGSATRAAGDYAATPEELGNRTEELGTAGAGGAEGIAFDLGLDGLTIGGDTREQAAVYVALATNANHFFPLHLHEYAGHHEAALAKASLAFRITQRGLDGAARSLMREAMHEEAFANHFLQDTFASGHMAPRSLDSIGHLTSETPSVVERVLTFGIDGVTNASRGLASLPGGVVGGAGGAVGGFVSSAFSWENPFAGAVSGAQDGASWGSEVGADFGEAMAYVPTAVARLDRAIVQAPANISDAAGGLLRTRNWHDYFCTLPNGLPTTMGRFHGDNFMDGNDLAVVSDECSKSTMEVFAAGQGQPQSYGVQLPEPNFSEIMADPMAGPVWRLMMEDYSADLAQARAEVDSEDRGRTDGGTEFNSRDVVDDIYRTTFGGAAGIAEAERDTNTTAGMTGRQDTVEQGTANPLGTVNNKRTALVGVIDSLHSAATANWGQNANLGGLNDDLNVAASNDPNETGFDPVMLENTFGLYSSLHRKATEFGIAASLAKREGQLTSSQIARLDREIAYAERALHAANVWKTWCARHSETLDDEASSFRGNVRDDDERDELRESVRTYAVSLRDVFGDDGDYVVMDSRLDVAAGNTAVG